MNQCLEAVMNAFVVVTLYPRNVHYCNEVFFGKEYDEKRREDCPLCDLEKVVREVYKHGNKD